MTIKDLARRNERVRHAAVRARDVYERLRDRRLGDEARWNRRSQDELRFWRNALLRGEYNYLLDPDAPVSAPCLLKAIEGVQQTEVSILDVGAGPLTVVGHQCPGKVLRITASDPLAEGYNAILDEAGMTPPVRSVKVAGEELLEHFGPGSFDIAFAFNALDHSNDPWEILQQMLEVARTRVALMHFQNEGEYNLYHGLHRWNVEVRDGELWFWDRNRVRALNVSTAVESLGWHSSQWLEQGSPGHPQVHVVLSR